MISTALFQGALAGIASGGVFAALAVTLTLMSRLARVVNFAQAATGMFAAFTSVWMTHSLGMPAWAAIVLGVLVGAILSGIIGWIATTWLADASVSRRSAMTIAPLLLLISLSFIVFGNKPQPFTPIFDGVAFVSNGVVVSWVALIMALFAGAVAATAALILRYTKLGIRLRALSDRPITAELIGISAKRLSIGVWTVTGAISALTILVIAPTQSNDAVSLSMLIIPATAAALIGGFYRLDYTLVGGLVLGMVTGMIAQIPALTLVRGFIPFLCIVVLLLWTRRKEVWDATR